MLFHKIIVLQCKDYYRIHTWYPYLRWLWNLINIDIIHKLSFSFLSLSSWGSRVMLPLYTTFSRGHRGYWGQVQWLYGRRPGNSLDESPAHRRALTDGSGCHTRCQLHICAVFKVGAYCSTVLHITCIGYQRENNSKSKWPLNFLLIQGPNSRTGKHKFITLCIDIKTCQWKWNRNQQEKQNT